MYKELSEERHKTGLVRLTGGNRGLVYCNERQEQVEVPVTATDGEDKEPQVKLMWAYDVYEVDDARSAASAKNSVIGYEHPLGDETKILRQTLALLLRATGAYNMEEVSEFRSYNEFCEALSAQPITGSEITPAPTDEELLAKAKQEKLRQIDIFDSSANVNAFTVGGQPMWLSFELRNRLKQSVDAAETEGRTELSKTFGGRSFTFPVATWKQMIAAVENYAGDCQLVTEQHKAAVAAMQTLAEVEAFDITTGYPDKLAF